MTVPAIETQLADFVQLFKEHAQFETVMLNPAVPAPRKRAAVAEITRTLGFVPPLDRLAVREVSSRYLSQGFHSWEPSVCDQLSNEHSPFHLSATRHDYHLPDVFSNSSDHVCLWRAD